MKEAIVTDLLGNMVDVVLVQDNDEEVKEVIEYLPSVEGASDLVPTHVGYVVSVARPVGLHVYVWSVQGALWIEGLSNEQISLTLLPGAPSEVDVLGEQLVLNDLRIMGLEAENLFLGGSIVDMDLRVMQLEGGVAP